MREGIPARVSEIDPTRFWVWVSNSELVPMLRKSQLPPIPRIRSPHSPAHSFALLLFRIPRICAFVRHAVETREACMPTQASKDSLQAAEYCQLLSAFSHRHPRTPDRIFTGISTPLPFLLATEDLLELLLLGPNPATAARLTLLCSNSPTGRTRSCTVFSCLPWPAA